MKNNSFKIIEAAKQGEKVHPIFAVILAIIFLTLGEIFMLFMLFLPKVETTFMKGIYDNIRMLLTFGGAILILFIWIRFVEKGHFHPLVLEREMDEKVFKRCVNRVCIYFNTSYFAVTNGSVKLQVQHITSTVIVGILGSLIAF